VTGKVLDHFAMLAATSAEVQPTCHTICSVSQLENVDHSCQCFGDAWHDVAAPCVSDSMTELAAGASATCSSRPCVASLKGCEATVAEASCRLDLISCSGKDPVEQCCKKSSLRWADIKDSPRAELLSSAVCSELSHAPPKRRWADLASEDEEEHEGGEEVEAEQESRGRAEGEEPTTRSVRAHPEHDLESRAPPASEELHVGRPRFARPSRSQRVAQVRRAVREFRILDFDAVDAAEQSGLVLRMLALLKTLPSSEAFWTEAGERQEEARHRLLGLEEEDMHALRGLIRRAEKLVDRRQFRIAFDALCEARPWILAGDVDALRLERPAARETQESQTTMKSERSRKSAELGWSRQTPSDDVSWTHAAEKRRRGRGSAAACPTLSNTTSGPGHSKIASDRRGRGERHSKGRSHDEVSCEDKHSAWHREHVPSHSRGLRGGVKAVAGTKLQCQFVIGIEEDSKFRVVRKVLGPAGANMKRINLETGAKLRLRGRGSKFLEGPEQKESQDPLMLCVSAPDQEAYERTVELVQEVLEGVYSEYREFCSNTGQTAPDLAVALHHGARDGSIVHHRPRSSTDKDGW